MKNKCLDCEREVEDSVIISICKICQVEMEEINRGDGNET